MSFTESRLSGLVACSPVMQGIFATVQRLAEFNTTVLITGESGTGKELLAKAIHENSPRKRKPFVAVNCGAIPENLIESELFGHKRGAFTDAIRDKKGLFEEAHGGTLFLDEIGELPSMMQVKILRALQERYIQSVGDTSQIPVDVRVVSATLRDLENDVVSGRFREDLLFRLNVVTIRIPPLRERREDIPLLINHFTEKHCSRLGIQPKQLPEDLKSILMNHEWKGNARELENCIERLLVLSRSNIMEIDALPEQISQPRKDNTDWMDSDDSNLSIKQRTRNLEIHLIQKALAQTKGNRTHAAKVLEISHRALLYKIKEYGL